MASSSATAPLPAAPRGPQGPRPPGEGGGEGRDEPLSAAAAAAGAAAGAPGAPAFRYWVDEVLWSQGRVATIQIEEVLDAMGGRRTGGPHKLATHGLGGGGAGGGDSSAAEAALAAAGATPGALQRPPAAGAAGAGPAGAAGGATAAAGSSSSGVPGARSQPLPIARRGGAGAGAASAGASSSASAAAAAAAAADAGSCSDADSEGAAAAGAPAASRRPDDHLLGYHHLDRWDLLWSKSVYAIKAARGLQPGQLVSVIAGLNSLTMKKRMVQTLRMALGARAFQYVPLSFCIPEDLTAWQAWLSKHGAAADGGLWMLKTGQDAGKGLRLVRTQHAMQVATRPPKHPGKPQSHIKVAQLYITRPLLIQGRKFHLRLWLLVTSGCPLRAYLHTRGLVLFSSEAYDASRPVDGAGVRPSASHVTNYARNEDTWVWDLPALEARLGAAAWARLWAAMREASAAVAAAALGPLRAARRWLQPPVQSYGFQMLGLDFLVDDAMRPWLLEVNSAPSIMAVHSDAATRGVIKEAKQAMLADMLAMVEHRLAPRRRQQQQQQQGAGRAAAAAGMSWQEELAAEMAARGGFEPLMGLFPAPARSGASGIPWQEQDLQLQRLLAQQQLQQQQLLASPPPPPQQQQQQQQQQQGGGGPS